MVFREAGLACRLFGGGPAGRRRNPSLVHPKSAIRVIIAPDLEERDSVILPGKDLVTRGDPPILRQVECAVNRTTEPVGNLVGTRTAEQQAAAKSLGDQPPAQKSRDECG